MRDDEGTLAMDYDGWYEKFETIDIVSMPPAANSGERFVPGWEGTGEGSVTYDALPATPSGVQIEVLAPIVQEVFWVIQYEFTIENPRGFGTPIPASGSYWFFDGERPEGRIDFYSGTHICTGFVGTGSVANGDTPYFRFVIHEPSSVEWLWDTPPVTPDESWTTAQSVTSGINGRTVAMKRQSDGSPFILFHEPVFGTIEAAYWHDDSWVTETVDTVGSGNLSAALMLDRFDVPFACYRRPATDEFVFATRDAAGWITQVIDSGDGVGMYSSMDIAEDGTILISYYVADTGELRIANSPAMHVKADHASDIELASSDR
ncbi:MAG: hypothetical protein U5N86_04850 [Planctomycetota bacterium]|nr:hypothetical protein [Planctomycetota bacterium]